MGLDINSFRGKISLEQEREVQEIIKNCWNVDIVETPKNSSAKCDGFLTRNNEIVAIFETKCRYDMGYNELCERGSWLITYDKILHCKKLSEMLQIPFLGFLYLLPKNSTEKLLLFWKITNNQGKFVFEFDVQNQETQKTINGGTIVRKNAYLPVSKSNFVKKNENKS
jgi:hypothetical protein